MSESKLKSLFNIIHSASISYVSTNFVIDDTSYLTNFVISVITSILWISIDKIKDKYFSGFDNLQESLVDLLYNSFFESFDKIKESINDNSDLDDADKKKLEDILNFLYKYVENLLSPDYKTDFNNLINEGNTEIERNEVSLINNNDLIDNKIKNDIVKNYIIELFRETEKSFKEKLVKQNNEELFKSFSLNTLFEIKRFNEETHKNILASLSDISDKVNNNKNYTITINKNTENYFTKVKKSEKPELFIIKKGSDIEPKDLLHERGLRKSGFFDWYLKRDGVDEVLFNLISNLQNTIITGKPLSGKSRAIYQAIKENFYNYNIIIPNEIDFPPREIELPVLNDKTIYIFNDIDKYLELKNILPCIRKILESENACIIATCRLERLEFTKSVFLDIAGCFNEIEIKPLSNTEKHKTEEAVQNVPFTKTDDTIGSYFYPIEQMIQYYRESSKLEKEILRSYKCVNMWRRRSRGRKEIIKSYCLMRYENYFNESNKISEFEWEQAFNDLKNKGLIYNYDEKIYIQDLYLDKFIASDESEKKVALEILRYYPDAENFIKLIDRVTSDELAFEIYSKMDKTDAKNNKIVYTSLIG